MKNLKLIPDFFKNLSVRTYLVSMGIIVSIIPIFLLSIINYGFISDNTIELLENKNLLLVESFSNKVKLYIDLNSKIIKLDSEIIYERNDRFIRNLFNNTLKNYTDIEFISYVNNDKAWLYNNKGEFLIISSNKIRIDSKYIIERLKYEPSLYLYLKEYNSKLSIVYPVLDKENNISGFLFATLRLNRFNRYSEYVFKYNEEPVIYDVKEDVVLNNKRNSLFIYKDFLKKELEKGKNKGLIKLNDRSITYMKIHNPDLVICIIHNLDEYYKQIENKYFKIIFTIVGGLLFALLIAFWVSSYQSKFVKSFLKSIRELSKGNYSDKITSNLVFIPKEFNSMINEFNIMAERIEKVDKFKSNLIDTVSHEFKTPLTSIKGFSSTLMRKDVNFDENTRRKFLKIISSQSDRLSRMVEDILVIPKLEEHTINLRNEYIEIENIIYDIVEFFPKCKYDISINDIKYIYCDNDKFQQIILNLCENACKYSSEKEEKIKIIISKEEEYAKFLFINRSEYIKKEKLELLFDKFVRLDDELTRNTGGTGLGLYITKALIEIMGGKVSLDYIDNEFQISFTLPINKD